MRRQWEAGRRQSDESGHGDPIAGTGRLFENFPRAAVGLGVLLAASLPVMFPEKGLQLTA